MKLKKILKFKKIKKVIKYKKFNKNHKTKNRTFRKVLFLKKIKKINKTYKYKIIRIKTLKKKKDNKIKNIKFFLKNIMKFKKLKSLQKTLKIKIKNKIKLKIKKLKNLLNLRDSLKNRINGKRKEINIKRNFIYKNLKKLNKLQTIFLKKKLKNINIFFNFLQLFKFKKLFNNKILNNNFQTINSFKYLINSNQTNQFKNNFKKVLKKNPKLLKKILKIFNILKEKKTFFIKYFNKFIYYFKLIAIQCLKFKYPNLFKNKSLNYWLKEQSFALRYIKKLRKQRKLKRILKKKNIKHNAFKLKKHIHSKRFIQFKPFNLSSANSFRKRNFDDLNLKKFTLISYSFILVLKYFNFKTFFKKIFFS